jgi:tight adherence protein C
METLAMEVGTWFNDPNNQPVLLMLMVGATIAIFVMGISAVFVGTSNPVKKRMGIEAKIRREEDASESDERRLVDIPTLIGPVKQWIIPSSEIERSALNKKLIYAGFRSPSSLETFYGIKALLTIILPTITFFVLQWFPDISTQNVWFAAFGAAVIGVIGPNFVLEKLVARRVKALRDGFPDALDLLVVCVESGLGLAAAIQRVSVELGVSHPELALELALVNAETRAGVDRAKALRNLADRSGLEDIRGLVSMLIQAMRFGTSIAETLRIYSEEFRDRRMQKAEELASKIGTKLIFPLVLCLFPSFFTVAIGPAILAFIKVFAQL